MDAVAERRFTARTVIACEPQEAFDWVADYRNVPKVLDGVTRWRPLGLQTRGSGARFDVQMRAIGFPIGNRLVLDTWEEPRAIAWRSESGLVSQRGGWSFRRRNGGTEVTLTISYRPPAGALGAAVSSRVDGTVRKRLARALERMKDVVERDIAGRRS